MPVAFRDQLSVTTDGDRQVTIDTPAELAPILGWLATLQLDDVSIESIGLRRVYDQYHRIERAVTSPRDT